jgi:hypothetical protein
MVSLYVFLKSCINFIFPIPIVLYLRDPVQVEISTNRWVSNFGLVKAFLWKSFISISIFLYAQISSRYGEGNWEIVLITWKSWYLPFWKDDDGVRKLWKATSKLHIHSMRDSWWNWEAFGGIAERMLEKWRKNCDNQHLGNQTILVKFSRIRYTLADGGGIINGLILILYQSKLSLIWAR